MFPIIVAMFTLFMLDKELSKDEDEDKEDED